MKFEYCPCCRYDRARRSWVFGAVAALLLAGPAAVSGDDQLTDTDHALEHPAPQPDAVTDSSLQLRLAETASAADPHAHHRHMLESKAYSRSERYYDLPDLAVVDMNGESSSLLEEISTDQPMMLNFIFTTCTTICPVMSATFAQVQEGLGAGRGQVRMVSISIDPEHDTPERLHAYAARFKAGSQWQFLTGSREDIVAIQKAFDAYRGTKANHVPLTFLRASAGTPWVRLEGLASASDVIREYEKLTAN
jgi:protein SCO1/2